LFDGDYPSTEARQQFFTRMLREVRNNPAFTDAAMTSRFRMTFGNFGQYEVDGQTYVTDRDRPRGNSEAVSDGYFKTLGLKILEGRDFTIEDNDAKQPVAIVNTSFARKYFGRESAIGRRIRAFNPAQPQEWRTIVGVVPDTMMQGPFNQQTDASGFYTPLLGVPPAPQFVTIVVKPQLGQSAETVGPVLSRAVAQVDANLPIYFGGTPARLHDEALGINRITASLFTIFGLAAVVLAAVGLYGVMSFSVNQRTQEFGIRMALGADARRIMKMVMRQGAFQLSVGLTLGVGAAALLLGVIGAAALRNFLFNVNTLDPLIYGSVAALLTLVAAASSYVPARRATRVNPITALRAE
jgi:predicted permease